MENYGLLGCFGCIYHKNKNKQKKFYHKYVTDYWSSLNMLIANSWAALALVCHHQPSPTLRRSRSEQEPFKDRRIKIFKPQLLEIKPNQASIQIWGFFWFWWILGEHDKPMSWYFSYDLTGEQINLKIWTFGRFIKLELSSRCLGSMTFINRTLNALKVTEQKYQSRDWNADVFISFPGFFPWKILLFFLLWNSSL